MLACIHCFVFAAHYLQIVVTHFVVLLINKFIRLFLCFIEKFFYINKKFFLMYMLMLIFLKTSTEVSMVIICEIYQVEFICR